MPINFNQLFAVKADTSTAKVPVLIPNLLWCRPNTRLRGVQLGPAELIALAGQTVDVRESDGTLILENGFPYLLPKEK